MLATNVVRALRDWRKRVQTRRELAGLDDAQLADIGLSRGDIDAVARGNHRRPRRDLG